MTDRPTDPQGQGQPPWGQQGPQWGQPAPYGQQWGQPAPYGQQPYGAPAPYGPYGGAPVTTSSRSTTVLVLGIVSLVTLFTCGLGFVTAVIALVMAPGARREIAESGGRLTGESQVRTGTILSWVTLGLTALAVVLLAVVIGVAISVDDGAGSPAEPTVVTPG
ncbi:MAG TPA: hypothetical protein VFT68_05985 [Lapillicoccus sp.]|nr:hypothetical protein [Lapillicoccus sp.]